MTSKATESSTARKARWKRFFLWLWGFWPHWPLAVAMMGTGTAHTLRSLKLGLLPFGQFNPFMGIEKSLAILGNSTEAILGIGLFFVGIGLLRKLAAAWSFGVILLLVTLGVNLGQLHFGKRLIIPALLLLAMIIFRHHFKRQSGVSNYAISLIGIFSIMAYGTFGSYLLGGGFKPPIHDLATAFYFTVITISTVGYGDISPINPETRLFVVSLLIVGLSVFATAGASVLGPAISKRLTYILNPEGGRMKLDNHIILAGEGPIANNTARELESRKISFVRIRNQSEKTLSSAQNEIFGDPTDETIQQQAGILTAQMLIAAGDNDGDNAFITLLAKDLNPDVRVLAVANAINAIRRLKLARADLVFAPAAVGSRLLANLAEGDHISEEFRDLLEIGEVKG